jgi:agmatinase
MGLVKADFERINVDGAGDSSANIFGFNFSPEESGVVLIPVPWDATASYGKGTAKGPEAIRRASAQLDFFDADLADLGLSKPWEFGIHMEKAASALVRLNREANEKSARIIAAGGAIDGKPALKRALESVNRMSDRLNGWVENRTRQWLEAGKIVGLVGGEHSVSFGAIKATAEHFGEVGVLHFDAHADLRDAYEGFSHSHASIMHNVVYRIPGVTKLVQVGIRDFCEAEFDLARAHPRISTWFDSRLRERQFAGETWFALCQDIIRELPRRIYISFDIDGLSPELCPHTGTPVAGGLAFAEAMYLLRLVAASGREVVAFDINEVAPNPKNGKDEWDGNVGARILYRMCGVALVSRGART